MVVARHLCRVFDNYNFNFKLVGYVYMPSKNNSRFEFFLKKGLGHPYVAQYDSFDFINDI